MSLVTGLLLQFHSLKTKQMMITNINSLKKFIQDFKKVINYISTIYSAHGMLLVGMLLDFEAGRNLRKRWVMDLKEV